MTIETPKRSLDKKIRTTIMAGSNKKLTFVLKKMRLAFIGFAFVLSALSVFAQDSEIVPKALYDSIISNVPKPNFEVFEKAVTGYYKLKRSEQLGDKNLLTIIDFSLSSKKRRLWIIDLQKKTILEHSLVAHGKNTGEEFAGQFSNKPKSYKSSLGFYITGETYNGKHGLSLYLHGVEEGINDNALSRSIVVHGAKYVSFDFINKYGRLGRSFGCPALPLTKHKKIIPLIANKTCLFIYSPNDYYLENSKLIN